MVKVEEVVGKREKEDTKVTNKMMKIGGAAIFQLKELKMVVKGESKVGGFFVFLQQLFPISSPCPGL